MGFSEPVYAVCSSIPYTNLTKTIRDAYRNFAEIESSSQFDNNIAKTLSTKKYPWLVAQIKNDSIIESKLKKINSDKTPTVKTTDDIKVDKNTVLQVLLIGDSMMKVGFGDILKKALKDLGKVEVTFFGKNSTGLVRQDFFDWFQQLDNLCKGKKYHLIVFMIGTNDAQGIRKNGKNLDYGTKEWLDFYRVRVQLFAKMLSGYSDRFYWIGMPPMLSKGFDGRMRTVTKIFEEEVGKITNGKFISIISILGDAKGNYTPNINCGGKYLTVRANDGVHFTYAGGDLLTKAVIEKFKVDFKR
jgi:hypothetical protein